MRESHDLAGGAPDDFTVRDQTAIAQAATTTTSVMTSLLTAIAAISLLVGGLAGPRQFLELPRWRRRIDVLDQIGPGELEEESGVVRRFLPLPAPREKLDSRRSDAACGRPPVRRPLAIELKIGALAPSRVAEHWSSARDLNRPISSRVGSGSRDGDQDGPRPAKAARRASITSDIVLLGVGEYRKSSDERRHHRGASQSVSSEPWFFLATALAYSVRLTGPKWREVVRRCFIRCWCSNSVTSSPGR